MIISALYFKSKIIFRFVSPIFFFSIPVKNLPLLASFLSTIVVLIPSSFNQLLIFESSISNLVIPSIGSIVYFSLEGFGYNSIPSSFVMCKK